jgi:hypothetical protein
VEIFVLLERWDRLACLGYRMLSGDAVFYPDMFRKMASKPRNSHEDVKMPSEISHPMEWEPFPPTERSRSNVCRPRLFSGCLCVLHATYRTINKVGTKCIEFHLLALGHVHCVVSASNQLVLLTLNNRARRLSLPVAVVSDRTAPRTATGGKWRWLQLLQQRR